MPLHCRALSVVLLCLQRRRESTTTSELHATAKQRLDNMREQTQSAPVHDADLTAALKLVVKAHREEVDRVQRMLSVERLDAQDERQEGRERRTR